jgi:hypothetical protein
MGGGPVASADHSRAGPCECWYVQTVVGGGGAYRFHEPPVLLVVGVVLDEEPLAVGMELTVELDDLPGDREHPASNVQIAGPEFRQLTPPQPAPYGRLNQELGIGIRQRCVDPVELLGGDDGPRGWRAPWESLHPGKGEYR